MYEVADASRVDAKLFRFVSLNLQIFTCIVDCAHLSLRWIGNAAWASSHVELHGVLQI